MMDIRAGLRQLRSIRRRIEEKRERLAVIRSRLTSGVQQLTWVRYGGGVADWTETEAKLMDMERDLVREIGELTALEERIQTAIAGVPEVPWRRILTDRYVYGWSWRKIARMMNYSEERVYQLHREALRILKECENGADEADKNLH